MSIGSNIISLGDLPWTLTSVNTSMLIYFTSNLVQNVQTLLMNGGSMAVNVVQDAFSLTSTDYGTLTGSFPLSLTCTVDRIASAFSL